MSLSERPHRVRNVLFLMVLAALAIRLVVMVFQYQARLDPGRDHWEFGFETGRIARSIASGEGFGNPLFGNTGPTAWMAPVYPYLLAAVFKLFGIYSKTSALVILSLNSLFSALTCLPVFFMARKSFGERVARWAGWTWVLFPYAIYFSAGWIWESCLTTLELSLLFLIALHLERTTYLAAWVGFGVLWGLAALTNPMVLSALPFLCGWVCYRFHQRGKRWALAAAMTLLGLGAIVTPWFMRNYLTFHQFIPFRDNFGLELHVGNNGDTSHWAPYAAHPSSSDAELQEYNRLGELAYMAEKQRQSLGFIGSHWSWFVCVTLRRVLYTWTGFWSLDRRYLAGERFDPPNILLSTTLTALALAGLVQAFRRGIAVAPAFALVLLSFPLIYYATHPETHYRHPLDPLLVVLAVYAASRPLPESRKTTSGEFDS